MTPGLASLNWMGRYVVGESGTRIKESLAWLVRYSTWLKVHLLWNHRGHSGFAIVEFGWVARDDDYSSKGHCSLLVGISNASRRSTENNNTGTLVSNLNYQCNRGLRDYAA